VPVTIQATDGGNAKVDTPLGTLHVPVHPALAVGDRGVLVLRPENVRISQDTHAELHTRVTDVTFTGADYRIDVNTNGVGLIATAARPVEPGSMAGVSINPTAAFITREARD
jgi:ABC-type Fe3+/spermidine/putrescine transport system ATPase subunit